MSLWLSPEELVELTGYKTSKRQKLALAELAVPFKSRPADGFPLVDRANFAISHKLTGARGKREPRWDLIT